MKGQLHITRQTTTLHLLKWIIVVAPCRPSLIKMSVGRHGVVCRDVIGNKKLPEHRFNYNIPAVMEQFVIH